MINILENVPLAQYTTFRIGGPARFFVEVKSVEELREALRYAQDNNLKFFVLGGGSNLLVSDKGFGGIVIKCRIMKYELSMTEDGGTIEVGSGLPLAKVVRDSIDNGLGGLEWAAGIPGTVGGAVRGNAGAFGDDMGGVVKSVKVLNKENLQVSEYQQEQCRFSYRGSLFKGKGNLIVLSAVLQLRLGNREQGLKTWQETIQQRIAKQPRGLPSAGSFFVNPATDNAELLNEFEKETGKKSKEGRVPAPWLIERADLKGKQIGGAQVSEVHANYIVNTGAATAEDVIMLASFIKQQVRDKFGIQLQEEVQYLGFS